MRSAEFDKELVLRSAIEVFASKGYGQTSMQDLKQATGLHPGSIYCAFENKQGLLISALEQYSIDRAEEFTQLFQSAPSIRAGLKSYLANMVQEMSTTGHQSVCLSQKALSEMGQGNPEVNVQISKNMEGWQNSFIDVFAKAIDSGEIADNRTAQQRAQYLIMGIYGLRTYAQTVTEHQCILEMAEQLLEDTCR